MMTRSDQTNDVPPDTVASRLDVPLSEERIEGPHCSPGRLAAYWGVHPNTIYRDIRKGALRAFRLPGGQLRIRTSDARKYGRPNE